MNHTPSNPNLPHAKSALKPNDREQVLRIVQQRNLCGLANDTKWDEFISAIRAHQVWRPGYRSKWINGYVTEWDVEWFYHLPFPFIGVEWMDVGFLQKNRGHQTPPRTEYTDHSGWIEELLQQIGLDYHKGTTTIRIFGYSPKDFALFDE